MSQIGDLIRELAPDGLPFRRVEDVVVVLPTARGIKRENYADGSLIPIVDQGQSLIAGYTDDESTSLPIGNYIVFGDHTRAVKWVDFAFAPGADGTKVLDVTHGLDLKFVYYAIANLNIPSRGYNRHWTVLRDLRIPVPPLKVQHEIARILDHFTELEAELQAELKARRRQYAFYRDQLLSFRNDANTLWVPMGELGEFTRGRRFVKDDVVEAGIPAIHYGEIYTHYGTSTTATLSHVREELRPLLRFAKTGDVVIAGVGETVEDVGKAVAWLGEREVAIHDDCFGFRHSMNPKFVAYCLQTAAFHSEKNKYVARAKVKRLSAEGLRKISIPVPPYAVQERIVDILDKFDALVNDLHNGLPAEINARRQQYRYYRDRLLTFDEAMA